MKKNDYASAGKPISLFTVLRMLFPFALASFPVLFLLTNAVGIAHGASFGLNTFLSQLFFDSVTKAVSQQTGLSVVLGLAAAQGAATIGSEILNGLHNFMGKTYYRKMIGYLSLRMNEKASRLDPIVYESPELLDDINKANEGMTNSLGLLFTAVTIFTFYIPYFIFMGFYLYTLKPILALSLILVFIPVVISQLIRGAVFAGLEDQAAPIRREFEYVERCICDREYYKETRILGAFAFFIDLYRSALSLLAVKTWKAELRTRLLELGMKMVTLAGYFGILYMLVAAMLNGEISIGSFAAVFASIGFMFGMMEEVITSQIGSMTKNLGTVRNFIRFLKLPERSGEDVQINAGDGVVLSGVSFRYPGADNESLADITLELKKGETVAIVGENGAGKTTLVKLMTGLYVPSTGVVRIGSADTRNVSAKSVHRGITAVFQKYQRYKMTLEDNIRISDADEREHRSEHALQLAVRKADLDEKAGAFPDGYATMLSREFDGADLSGGLWQRVAIARGFYRIHGMIVLDEPTAAIDPIEESNLYRKFAEIAKDKTAIIVTHRLGSAKIADRIVVLDQGRIAETGTHDELMRKAGKYAEMFSAQAQWYSIQH
jgi:ATP-binding cassette subfamily B protein